MLLIQPFLSNVRSASSQQPQPKSFKAWCLQRNSVPADTKQTIDVLLKKADTTDCKLANSKLNTLTELDLSDNRISDMKPLARLTNLTDLSLMGNQISDVKPLAGLTKLTKLNLRQNKISDFTSLSGLTKLTDLWLNGNPIAEKVCPVKPES